jgi:hypothetical protein
MADGRAEPRDAEWSADRFYTGGRAVRQRAGEPEPAAPRRGEAAPAPLEGVAATQRSFAREGAGRHGYRIPVPPGRYRVTLHFAELLHTEPGARRFSVDVEGRTAVEDLDLFAANGREPFTRVVAATVADGLLDVVLVDGAGVPVLNGLEVEAAGE